MKKLMILTAALALFSSYAQNQKENKALKQNTTSKNETKMNKKILIIV